MATSLILLPLVLFPFSVFADVDWNIDCGASESYYDNDISWLGDKTLMSTGQTRTVEDDTGYTFLQTVRVFNSGKKNCYVLKAEKGVKVLVLASFYYGNFDGKSSPPSFGLQIDGNDWVEVVTNMDTENYITHEVIYITKGDGISVCLVQTNPNQYPFISALQVRTLDSTMYGYLNPDQALSNVDRYSYGGSEETRDNYARIWSPTTLPGDEYVSAESNASPIATKTAVDDPPVDAIRSAITTSNDSAQALAWTLTDLNATPSTASLILYFSEVSELDATDKRSFSVHLDKKLVKESVTPKYGSVTELAIYNVTASKSTTITLTSTPDSTLPPIINAMELFFVVDYTVYSPGPKPTSGKKKSSLPVILGTIIPGFLVLVAFVVVLVMVQQKRKRAAIAAAAGGARKDQGTANYSNYDNNNGLAMTGTAFGQEMMNEFKGDVADQATAKEDPNYHQHDQYKSPDPLLNQMH